MKRKLIAMIAAGAVCVSMAPAYTAYAEETASTESVQTQAGALVEGAQADADVPVAGPDDVVVRTSIGSGQVIFTRTDEPAQLSAWELSELVKSALENAVFQENYDAFLDTEADVKIELGQENQMEIQGSLIATLKEYEHKEYGSLFYNLNGIGESVSGQYEGYHWADGENHYTALNEGEGWKVKAEDAMEEVYNGLNMILNSKPVEEFSLDGLKPNLYEEDGVKYYVCVMDKNMLLDAAYGFNLLKEYLPTADDILGDNEVTLTVVANAETGMIRAASLDVSGISAQIPGKVLGAEGSFGFSADQLYATFLMGPNPQDFEVPEEVRNTPVEDEYGFVKEIVSKLGIDKLLGVVSKN